MLILEQDQADCSLVCDLLGLITVKSQLKALKHTDKIFHDTILLFPDEEPSDTERALEDDAAIDTRLQQLELNGNGSSSVRSLRGSQSSSLSISSASATATIAPETSVTPHSTSTHQDQVPPTHRSLPRGEHIFQFEFDLPKKGLFNSLEFERGSISYVITATFKSGPMTSTCKKNISVICPIDVSLLPIPKPSVLSIEVRKRKRETGIITSQIEIPQRGYLRGDSIQVTVTVNHTQAVKSMHGVIVTLFRVSRVSGGQSGERQSFRKDLAQTVSSLITNEKKNYSQTISNKIKVPLEVFPTTKGSDKVNFQYCIEAVIDLAGKWNLKMKDDESSLSRLGFVETDKLKKLRGVVSLWMEVVIGTERGPVPSPSPSRHCLSNAEPQRRVQETDEVHSVSSNSAIASPNLISVNGSGSGSSPSYNRYSVTNGPQPPRQSPSYAVSEKDRLRQMEAALLPSEPATSSHAASAPSAPVLNDPTFETDPSLTAVTTPAATMTANNEDKLEREQRYLATRASEPLGNGEGSSRDNGNGSGSAGAGDADHIPDEFDYDVPAYELAAAAEPAGESSAPLMFGDVKGEHLLPSEPPASSSYEAPSTPSAPINDSESFAPSAPSAPPTDAESFATSMPSAPTGENEPSAPLMPSAPSHIETDTPSAPPAPGTDHDTPSAPPPGAYDDDDNDSLYVKPDPSPHSSAPAP